MGASLTDTSLADELVRLLYRRGPLSDEEIAEALGEDAGDPDWDAELEDALDGLDRLVDLADGRLADTVALLSATTLTRRVTAEEVERGWLRLGGDLQPFVDVIADSAPLARGGRVHIEIARLPGQASAEWLVGPAGWLGDATPGDLVGVCLADGLVTVSVRPEPADSQPASDALASVAGSLLADSSADPPRIAVAAALWEALASQPQALGGVLAPLSELAQRAGLQLAETMLLPADAPAGELGSVTDAIHNAIATVHHGADGDQLAGLAHLRDVTRRLEVGADVGEDDLAVAARHLADPDVLDCYLSETQHDSGAARLAAAAAPWVSGTARAAVDYVQAQAALTTGDAVTADARATDALAADPAHEPSLVLAARFAEARGDAATAVRHLDAAGWDDTDWADDLRARLAPRRDVGRNQPCPCGSGRKFKVCCAAGGGATPLPQRALWLRTKLAAFTEIATLTSRLRERLMAAGRPADWVDEEAADHPIVADVVIFELGVLDDYLAGWGPLLPDDERALAASWRDSRRRLYDVVSADGDQVTLTDRGDGARLVAHSPGGAPPAGRLLVARLLPDGGDGWLLSGAALADQERHPAVACSVDPDADPLDVAELWGGDQPVVTTAEGEPMMVCEWRAPLGEGEPETLAAALGRAGLSEDAPGVFVETVEVDDGTRVRGTVTVTGAAVEIDTNAEARLDRLVGRVREALGNVAPDVDRRTPMWQVMEDLRLYGVPEPPAEPSASERAVVDEMMREHEQRWIDEPIPALDGLTPREARDHPTGRAALEELLASLPATAGGFDPDRLRELLDLPPRSGGPAGQTEPAGSRGHRRREARTRVEFVAPPLEGEYDGIDVAQLDPTDADERSLHIEAEHELAAVWDGDDPHHDPSASAGAHYALHEVVAAQIVDDEPPEVWATAQRLVEDGYDRHEVIHMIAGAVAAELWHTQTAQQPFDQASYLQRLELLPESWEQERGRRRPR